MSENNKIKGNIFPELDEILDQTVSHSRGKHSGVYVYERDDVIAESKQQISEMVKEIVGEDIKAGDHMHVNYHNNLIAQQKQIARERGFEL